MHKTISAWKSNNNLKIYSNKKKLYDTKKAWIHCTLKIKYALIHSLFSIHLRNLIYSNKFKWLGSYLDQDLPNWRICQPLTLLLSQNSYFPFSLFLKLMSTRKENKISLIKEDNYFSCKECWNEQILEHSHSTRSTLCVNELGKMKKIIDDTWIVPVPVYDKHSLMTNLAEHAAIQWIVHSMIFNSNSLHDLKKTPHEIPMFSNSPGISTKAKAQNKQKCIYDTRAVSKFWSLVDYIKLQTFYLFKWWTLLHVLV